jgi:hypothetical protein
MSTATIRPNGAGDSTAFTGVAPVGSNHYAVVSDQDNATYVFDTSTGLDLYALEDSGLYGTISQIEVFIHCLNVVPPGNTCTFTIEIKTGGSQYSSSSKSVTSAADFSYVWSTNPQTGNAWTFAEIDALQAGIKNTTGGNVFFVSELWVVITYTPTQIKAYDTVAQASIGKASGVAIASIKKIMGVQ